MKYFKIILLVALTTSLTYSCGDDDSDDDTELVQEGGPFEFSELAGNWEGIGNHFFRPFTNEGVDIVFDGGSVSLTVQTNGKCTFTINPVDCDVYTESGEMFWELGGNEDYLEIVWDGSSPDEGSSFRAELTDTTFNLWCGPEQCVEYDFNCEGTPEPATLSFSFTRE